MNFRPQAMPRRVHEEILPDLQYLESLEDARKYIHDMDFSWQKFKMISDRFVVGWSMEKLDFVEAQYKNMLFLWRKYPDLALPPPEEVDDFWHGHILDTQRYHNDTMCIFGRYYHHYPYFGMRGSNDRVDLEQAFIKTQRLYKAEFGDWLRDWAREDGVGIRG